MHDHEDSLAPPNYTMTRRRSQQLNEDMSSDEGDSPHVANPGKRNGRKTHEAPQPTQAEKDAVDATNHKELKEKYKKRMSSRDYKYFDTYSEEDRRRILIEAKLSLQHANVDKIKIKTTGMEFLGIVSHELRTPLNGLIGVIDLMQADEMSDDQRLYCKTLEQSCTHLLSVVSRMQDLAALQYDGAALRNNIPFDIVATITGVAESMQHMSCHTGRGTQVALDLDPDLPLSVNGDVTKIQQVISNLVGIATTSSSAKYASLKATFDPKNDKEAKIHIEIKGKKTQTPTALLEGFDLEFSFEDLFQPLTFNNMSQSIVICREFLVQIGSKLEMNIEDDETLVFCFALDVTYDRKAVARDYEGELEGARETVKILVAEDNKVSRLIAKTMLSKLGFTDVDDAENGKEAVDAFAKKNYDVILMDCDMPVMTGYEACEHIRTVIKNDTVKIVALTANSTNDAKCRCIKSGMNDWFCKPITLKTLKEMLYKWLPHA